MRRLALVLFACSTFAGSAARAERGDQPGEGALREAVELLRRGRCDAAIPLLQQSYAEAQLRNALWNMAECYAALNRPGQALETYRSYLEHPETQSRSRDLAAARVAIARLEPLVAPLTVTSNVADAIVRVDGAEVGRTPLVTHVGRGLHILEVLSLGYVPFRQEIQVTPRQVLELEASLTIMPGALSVTSEPPGARVLLDGEALGQTPFAGDVPAGGHLVEVSLEGYRTEQRRVTVPYGQQTGLEVTLLPSQGTLAVATDVSDAALEVDGEPRGTSPFPPLELPPGRHRLAVTAPGHLGWTGEIDILDSRTTTAEIALFDTGGLHQAWFWSLLTVTLGSLAGGTVLAFAGLDYSTQFNATVRQIEVGGESGRDLAELQQRGEVLLASAEERVWSAVALLSLGLAAAIATLVVGLRTRFRRGSSSAEIRLELSEAASAASEGVTP